jgi:hypothetical protein
MAIAASTNKNVVTAAKRAVVPRLTAIVDLYQPDMRAVLRHWHAEVTAGRLRLDLTKVDPAESPFGPIHFAEQPQSVNDPKSRA